MDWWRLSDHNVSKVSEDVVLSLSPGVFMLFYDCVDPVMVPNDEDVNMQDADEVANLTPDAADGLDSATGNTSQISQGHESQKVNDKPEEAHGWTESATSLCLNDEDETITRGSGLVANTASQVQVEP
jgi:ubiquitin carboxyl-terminal hydrolase 1